MECPHSVHNEQQVITSTGRDPTSLDLPFCKNKVSPFMSSINVRNACICTHRDICVSTSSCTRVSVGVFVGSSRMMDNACLDLNITCQRLHAQSKPLQKQRSAAPLSPYARIPKLPSPRSGSNCVSVAWRGMNWHDEMCTSRVKDQDH